MARGIDPQPSRSEDGAVRQMSHLLEAEFNTMYEDTRAIVGAIAYSLAKRDEQLALDIAQMTYISAARYWPPTSNSRGQTNYRAWICTIARHVASNELRRRHYDDISLEAQVELKIEPPDPHDVFAQAEEDPDAGLSELTETCLDVMLPKQRSAVTLHYLDELPAEFVAQTLGVTERAAQVLIGQGIVRARNALADQIAPANE
jgi:RNA polymerase sigma factor (sigma-70 family)